MIPSRYRQLVWIFLAGMFMMHGIIAWNSWELIRRGYPDFTPLYSAGQIVGQGQGSQLYDYDVQWRAQQQFGDVAIRQGPLPYNHPPFEALLFVPLAWLPYPVAFILWDSFNVLLLLLLKRVLQPHIPALQEISWVLWLLVLLSFYPIFEALLQGQDILLLLGLLSCSFAGWKSKQDGKAGFWLGLGVFRFHLVLPLFLIFLCKRRWKLVAGFLLAGCLAAALSVAVTGWHAFLDYPRYVLQTERQMEGHLTLRPLVMPNLRGLVEGSFLSGTSRRGKETLLAVASLAAVLFAASRWRGKHASSDLGFALAIVTAVLVSYHALPYDLSLLILPVLLVLNRTREGFSLAKQVFLFGPIVLLFFSPLHQVLFLAVDHYNWMAWVLMFWMGAIALQIADEQPEPGRIQRA